MTNYAKVLWFIIFHTKRGDENYYRNRYVINQKSCITFAISHKNAGMKVDSFYSFPLE